MTLTRRTLSSLAALGLAITTAIAGMPTPTASAGPLPDVAVKYDGYNYGANGQLNVAFGITNKDAPANNVKLKTSCNYRYKSNDTHSRTENGEIPISLLATQSVPVPKLVTCNPHANEFVSSVIMVADVPGGDSTTPNNTAIWDYKNNLPKPDVKAAYWTRQSNTVQGWAKVSFVVTTWQADAPAVKLHSVCTYRYKQNKGYAGQDIQDQMISLKKGHDPYLKTVDCAARPGQYVSSAVLNAEVQKPWSDANTGNNVAVWDLVTSG